MNIHFKKIAVMVSCAACACSFALLTSGCYFFPSEEAMLDPPVIKAEEVTYSTYAAKLKTITNSAVVTGYVYSKTQEDCYFTSYTGNIKTIYPRVGDYVEQGDLIAEMNVGTLEYELEIQRLTVELAKLNYDATGSAEDLLKLEIERNTLAKYQAEYDGARIYAPISGQVSFVQSVSPGDLVDPYSVLVRIVDPEDLYVSATAPENSKFKLNDSVTINIGGTAYNGTISITPEEAQARALENPQALAADFVGESPTFAFLGKLADVTLVIESRENAVVIPKNLVKTLDGRTYVQILEDGVKKDVDIVTGISNATEIEVVSGLSAGAMVVVK